MMRSTSVQAPDIAVDPVGADEAARAAAEVAGVEMREMREMEQVRGASAVFDTIWGDRGQVAPELAIALAHADNYVVGAESRGSTALVGALIGFRGLLEDGDPYLHSHILGVLPGAAAKGVGFAMKLHQRAWALGRGIETIGWTFDPLVSRNAYFNVTKLGADVVWYRQNFYGRMSDAQNGDDDSDRILVLWKLNSKRATLAAAGRDLLPSISAQQAAVVVLGAGPDGEPVAGPAGDGAELVSIQVPGDIVTMRRDRPDLAVKWRRALRESLGVRLSAGGTVVSVTRSGSYIVLNRRV